MNPDTHHNTTGEQRKRKAPDTRDDDGLNHSPVQEYASSSSYMINGSANSTMVCCPCIHCPLGWHDGMTMAAGTNVDEVATKEPDLDALPIGYRFVPTDEELITQYLIKKIKNESVPKSKIHDADIYESHPKVLVDKYSQAIEDTWYFFTPRSRKYANGDRPDRQAGPGSWKATGPDKFMIVNDVKGRRKSLVYYIGPPSNSTKTKWMMHEYVIKDYARARLNSQDNKLDNYVISKIYINGKMKDEVDIITYQQRPSVASNDGANLPTNVRVEKEPVLAPDDQPGHLVVSNQDVDGENNVVVLHDSDQNQNYVGTCMSSLVENSVVAQTYQNTQSLYDLVPPYLMDGIFSHEYSPLNAHNVTYGSGSTSNYSPVFAQLGYDGFLDGSYQPEFDASNEYLYAYEQKS